MTGATMWHALLALAVAVALAAALAVEAAAADRSGPGAKQ